MLISIITINKDNSTGLSRTLKSLQFQINANFELIIIDGASTDASLELIGTYNSIISKWISEPDNGIYDAMNKGIRLATGKYLLFLNSGDWLFHQDVLSHVTPALDGTDIISGNMNCIDPASNLVKWPMLSPVKISAAALFNSTLPHQATFIRRDLFFQFGFYNVQFKIASDWLFFLEVILQHNVSYSHFDGTISNFMLDGISSNPKSKNLAREEQLRILEEKYPHFLPDYIELFRLQNQLSDWQSSKEFRAFILLQKMGIIGLGMFYLRINRLFHRKFDNIFL